MMRNAYCLMIAVWLLGWLAGCSTDVTPPPPPSPEPLRPAVAPTDGTAELAAAWVYIENRKGPAVKPEPQPGDVCPNCNGTGKVGDGTVMVTCAPCNGTGKVLPKEEQPKPAEPTVEELEARAAAYAKHLKTLSNEQLLALANKQHEQRKKLTELEPLSVEEFEVVKECLRRGFQQEASATSTRPQQPTYSGGGRRGRR